MREGWLRGRVQKLEDNGGRKKGRSREERRERESIERERQLAAFSRDDAPNRRFGSLRRRRGRPASCISVLHYTYRGGTRIHTHDRVYGRATRRNGNNQVVCVPEAVRARARARPSLLASLSPVYSFPFPGEPHTGCSRMCVLTERATLSSSHASPQRSMSTRCHASA